MLRIKQLLYEEGFTIAGAKKRLEAELTGRVETPQEPQPAAAPTKGDGQAEDRTRAALLEVREQLREMLTLLNRDGRKLR